MPRKKKLIELIVENLNREVDSLTLAAQAAHEAATHEESKAEDAHDTRGLEASYLAGAQMARIDGLKKALTYYQFFKDRKFSAKEPIGAGALIELECDKKRLFCFLVAQAGGTALSFEGKTVQVITPQSPLGEALLGRLQGDWVEVEAQKGVREYEILSVE